MGRFLRQLQTGRITEIIYLSLASFYKFQKCLIMVQAPYFIIRYQLAICILTVILIIIFIAKQNKTDCTMFQQIIKRQSEGQNSNRPSFSNRNDKNSQCHSKVSDTSSKSTLKTKNGMFTQILNKNTITPRLKAYLDHYQIFREQPNQQQVILRVKNNYNINDSINDSISCRGQIAKHHNEFVMMKQLKIDNYYDLKRVIQNLQLQKELSHENLLSLIWYQVRSQVKVTQMGQLRKRRNNQTRIKQNQRVKYKNLRQSQIQNQREIHIITLFYQYFPVTIQQQIYNRTVQERYFQQFQIWSLLYSCVSGLAYLEKKNICHSSVSDFDIFLTQDGFVKIIDPSIATYAPLQQFTEEFYYSPQLLEIYKQKRSQGRGIIGFTNNVNIFKADVYSLGMVIMQACLLQNCSDCYNYQDFMVEGIILKQKFNTLTKYYSTKLLDVIYLMINFKPEKRPSFQELQIMIMSILESPKQHAMINSIQSLQQNLLQSQDLTTIKGKQAKTGKMKKQERQQKDKLKSENEGKQIQGHNNKNQIKVINSQPCAPTIYDEQDILPVDSLANEYGIDIQKMNIIELKENRKQVFESIKDSFVKQIRKFQHSLRKKITSQKSGKQKSQQQHDLKEKRSVSQFDFQESCKQQSIVKQKKLTDQHEVKQIKQQDQTKQKVHHDQIKIVIVPPKQQQLKKTQKKQFQINLKDNSSSDLNKTQQFTLFKRPPLDKKQKGQTENDQYLRNRLQQIKQQSYYRYLPQDLPSQQKIKQQFAVSIENIENIENIKEFDQNLKESACTNPQFLKMINEEIQRIRGQRKNIQTKLSVLR